MLQNKAVLSHLRHSENQLFWRVEGTINFDFSWIKLLSLNPKNCVIYSVTINYNTMDKCRAQEREEN